MNISRMKTNSFLYLLAVLGLAGLVACAAPPAAESQSEAFADEAQAEAETAPAEPHPVAAPAPKPKPKPQAYTAPTPAPPPPVITVTVPAGTEVHVTLSSVVDSATSQIGDQLTASASQPVVIGDREAIPSGSTIYGEVVDVIPAKKGLKVSEKGGSILLAFNQVTTPSGTTTDLRASLAEAAKSGAKTGKIIGGSAAGGAVLGKLLGDKSKDTAVGAVIGTGIGTAVAAGTKGKEVTIPEGAELVILIDEDLTIPVT